MANYIKLNSEPIEIEHVEDEHDSSKDFEPSFWVRNKRYYIDDFLRCHNNAWITDTFPEYIHGIEAEEYYDPLYIEIVDGGNAVNAYEYKAS